jgi:solute carrier family 25 phosphate transporter 3
MVNRLLILGKEAGVKGLFAGLGPRMSKFTSQRFTLPLELLPTFPAVEIQSPESGSERSDADGLVMTAGLVSSQFIMYGYIKQALGARPGIEIHKE